MSGIKMRKSFEYLYKRIDGKFMEQFGFRIRQTNLSKIAVYMHQPKDVSSLAVTRIIFGIAMLFDIPDERGGATIRERWGNPSKCHFPLVDFIQALPMPYMAVVYAGLWFGAVGIALGYKFHTSCATFTACFWYLLLIEKSYWNNHSYLFGLVAFLLTFTRANCSWSLDAYQKRCQASETVPYWNYFILKYQFFILYFMAGVKKGTAEWLTGYSVQNLSEHWVFDPFKLFMTVPQTDYLVVHWFVFAFDLTVAIWMMWSRTRHFAMVFCALFHLMNSRLFRIGMFPWVCLATMPLFYPFDWPKTLINRSKRIYSIYKVKICNSVRRVRTLNSKDIVKFNKESDNKSDNDQTETVDNKNVQMQEKRDALSVYEKVKDDIKEQVKEKSKLMKTDAEEKSSTEEVVERKQIVTCLFIALFVFIQAFLPFSHFITNGYNNWTNGLYGYSWDMMVHSWDVHSVIVKVVDNEKKSEFFIDPYYFTPNDRWTRHGDMVYQYARCLQRTLAMVREGNPRDNRRPFSDNISIYIDVWTSLNGRFTQRMFDPDADLLKVTWSPLAPVSFLMPLLDEALEWRQYMLDMREAVHTWNNYADVVFIADFPGYDYEKYIPFEIRNVTLTVLEGLVVYEPQITDNQIGKSYLLTTGNWINIASGIFHKVRNVGDKPSFYMFTFHNATDVEIQVKTAPVPKLPIMEELSKRFYNMVLFGRNVVGSLFNLFLNASKCQ